ncbi:MAG TPA: glycosyltransferase family A protein, partial [Candidatus Methylomirabilis sp.]|nr:glycosyltransferase family A protein [Candidatus Methylomirabilis sp.]
MKETSSAVDLGPKAIAVRPPRVSVGVPVFNGDRFLRAALDSILGQTFQDYEIIISDNASEDGTEEICRDYATRDPRVRYSRLSTNLGANPNFNRVVELSRGTYFKLANADDLCNPDLLARCVAVLDGQREVVLCYGQTTLIGEDGVVLGDYNDNLDLPFESAGQRFRAVVGQIGLVNVL